MGVCLGSGVRREDEKERTKKRGWCLPMEEDDQMWGFNKEVCVEYFCNGCSFFLHLVKNPKRGKNIYFIVSIVSLLLFYFGWK